jgi:outer membrane protein OmpA-like peptidoglycan-associated protein
MSTQPTQQAPLVARANRVNGKTRGSNVHRLGFAPRAAAGILFLALQACAGMHEDAPLAPQRAAMAPRHIIGAFVAPTPKTLAREQTAPPAPVPAVSQEPAGAKADSATARPAPAEPPEAMGEEVVSISFERGSAKPPAAAASVLAGLAQRGRLAPLIVVDGYARSGGADNLALAHQRALAVKDELVARGLDEKRIRTNAATSENADPLSTRVEVRLVARTRTLGL